MSLSNSLQLIHKIPPFSYLSREQYKKERIVLKEQSWSFFYLLNLYGGGEPFLISLHSPFNILAAVLRPVKKRKSSVLASVSPRHCRAPMEKGIKWSSFLRTPAASRNRSGQNRCPSTQCWPCMHTRKKTIKWSYFLCICKFRTAAGESDSPGF